MPPTIRKENGILTSDFVASFISGANYKGVLFISGHLEIISPSTSEDKKRKATFEQQEYLGDGEG